MSVSISDLKLRIATLEKLIEHQSKAYSEGYHQALIDSGLVMSDVPLEEMCDEYRSNLYSRAFANYPMIR